MEVAQAVDQVRPSIIQIMFHASDFSNGLRMQLGKPFISRTLGTGFIVNSGGYVITARHVVKDIGQLMEYFKEAGTKQLYVGLAIPNTENMRGNFSIVQFNVADEDALHDLVLLKLKRNPFKGEVRSGITINSKEIPLLFGTATLNPDRPKDGAAVGISGYPLNEPVLVTNVGWMATSWAFETKEVSVPGAPDWFYYLEIADSYLADVQANPGNSGAPVYLIGDGTVIGVCIASKLVPIVDQWRNVVTINGQQLRYSSGLTIVVPSSYVIDLLKKHSLNWSE